MTRRALRARGARSVPAGMRASTRAHPLHLTQREDEVLELICSGRTNAQIAERLLTNAVESSRNPVTSDLHVRLLSSAVGDERSSISAKTVDHHVSAVLAKLAVPTRGAAASEATRRGLVAVPRS